MGTAGEKGPRDFETMSPLECLSTSVENVTIPRLLFVFCVLAGCGFLFQIVWLLFPFAAFILSVIVFENVAPIEGQLTIFDDGIRIRWMGRSRLVNVRDLDGAEVVQRILGPPAAGSLVTQWTVLTAVRLRTKTGEVIEVGMERKDADIVASVQEGAIGMFIPVSAEVSALKEAIEQRFGASKRVAENGSAERLRRGDRDVRAWLADAVGSGCRQGGGYRSAEIPMEVLWNTLENPALEASVRVGAAVALRPGCDAVGVARLRVVVEGCGTVTVRAALAEVAKGAIDIEATDGDRRIRVLEAVR